MIPAEENARSLATDDAITVKYCSWMQLSAKLGSVTHSTMVRDIGMSVIHTKKIKKVAYPPPADYAHPLWYILKTIEVGLPFFHPSVGWDHGASHTSESSSESASLMLGRVTL